jgi:hypothetical protein
VKIFIFGIVLSLLVFYGNNGDLDDQVGFRQSPFHGIAKVNLSRQIDKIMGSFRIKLPRCIE